MTAVLQTTNKNSISSKDTERRENSRYRNVAKLFPNCKDSIGPNELLMIRVDWWVVIYLLIKAGHGSRIFSSKIIV